MKTGEIQVEGNSITEGIGSSRVTANHEGTPIDDAYWIDDQSPLQGLPGRSGRGIRVTLLCDGGAPHRSRLFNPEWLEQRGLVTA